MATLELRWEGSHDGTPRRFGYDGDFLVGAAAYYDVVGGGDPGWVGFVNWERVTGRCTSDLLAMQLVDERAAAHLERRARSRRRPE